MEPAWEMRRAPTVSPMRAERLGATLSVFFSYFLRGSIVIDGVCLHIYYLIVFVRGGKQMDGARETESDEDYKKDRKVHVRVSFYSDNP